MSAVRHWFNGAADSAPGAEERALHYGDGVFETLRVGAGGIEFLDRHMQRLRAGCERLQLDHPDWEALCAELGACAGDNRDAVLKVLLWRGRGERGYGFRRGQGINRLVSLYPGPAYPAGNALGGIRVHVCGVRLAGQPRLAGIKHLNRLEQVLARADWDAASGEGLMLDYHDNLVEGTMSNLFVVSGDTLITPRLERCGVAGVMRSVVIDLAAHIGLATRVEPLPFAALRGGDAVFVCNSLIGIWPVVAIAGEGEFEIDSWTRRLQQALDAVDRQAPGTWYSV